ncbi:MAG: hypothetical protein KDA44_15710 [Planctomycetales bacterium]|nr:hypothetical protein [Planctomycetales bacterium]
MINLHRLSIVATVWMTVLASLAAAQVPVATGRQFTLSNPAWKLFIPSTYEQRPDGAADLLVHFHGDPQTVWNNARYAHLNAIVVTVNYSGLSSAYSAPFSNAALFRSIVDEALDVVRAQRDFAGDLSWDQLGVSSFSAGYGAVREILKSRGYRAEIDALLAADSLYATTAGDGTPLDSQLADYKTFAAAAAAGEKTFLFSHSQVPTYTYESTAECGDELLESLGATAQPVNETGLGTLNFYRQAHVGNFWLRGATGSNGDAHLEHLRYIGEYFDDLPLAKLATPPGDFDGNYLVDNADLATWTAAFGATADGDADGNGQTDGGDFLVWQRNLGATSGASAAATSVPEPAAAPLLAVGACLWRLARGLRRRVERLQNAL